MSGKRTLRTLDTGQPDQLPEMGPAPAGPAPGHGNPAPAMKG